MVPVPSLPTPMLLLAMGGAAGCLILGGVFLTSLRGTPSVSERDPLAEPDSREPAPRAPPKARAPVEFTVAPSRPRLGEKRIAENS